MFTLQIDTDLLQKGAALVGATEKQLEAATTSTLRKVKKRIETRIKRRAAKELRIPQRAIGDRFFSNNINPGESVLKVWIGTWAVSPYSIGSPAQTLRGVRVGRRSYPGAFLANIYTTQEKVWIRLHSPHYSPDLYPTKYRSGDRGLAGLRGRFPVVRAAVPIDGVVSDVVELEGDAIMEDFEKLFLQELNYQVNVKGQA